MAKDPNVVVTIKEIADRAGFSHAAVSSVLNGRAAERRISPRTVETVEPAARALGYVSNSAARRLHFHVSDNSHAILEVITSFEMPLSLVNHAASALQRRIDKRSAVDTRFTISVELFNAGHLLDLLGILTNNRFSDALIANTIDVDDRFLAEAYIPFPFVVIGRRVPGRTCVVENPETDREAAFLLIRSGCLRGAVLCPSLGMQTDQNRIQRFAETLAVAGLPTLIELRCGDCSESAGCSAMRAYLRKVASADGFFAVNDTSAIGTFQAVREAGLSVSKNMCFVCVGDSDAAPFLAPPLTCLGSSLDALHSEAAALLFGCFSGHDGDRSTVQLPLQCLLRGSTRIDPRF